MRDNDHYTKLGLRLVASAIAISAATIPAAVAAQDGDEDQAKSRNSSDVIIVTASRREEGFTEAPVAVTAINNDEIISRGVVDINGLADFAPGLTATDGGSPGLGNLVIRGIYAGGAPTVGTYIDDVPYGAVVGGFAANTALDATLYDLERVEIIKGPQGTLFGSSSVGGVVRYVTRKPDLQDVDGYGFADLSTTESGSANVLLRGRVSVPLAKDIFAVSASGYYQDSGGFIDNGITGEKDIDDSEYYGFRLAGRLALGESVLLDLSYTRHEANFDSASYVSFNPTTGNPIYGPLQTDFAAPRTLEFDVVALAATIDFGFAELESITSFQNNAITNVTDITATLGPVADALSPTTAPNTVGFRSGDDTNRFTQELRLTSMTDGPFEWIAGAYYTKQESDSFQIADVSPGNIDLVTLNSSQRYEEFAFFGNLTYFITPNWEVTGGLRYSITENEIDQAFTGALSNPLLDNLQTVQDDDVFTFLFNTRYEVSEAVNIYARVANGFRPGGANLTLNLMGTVLGEPSFAPDNLWSYEAGMKGRLGANIFYDIGAYYIDWDDAQIAVINAAGLASIGNATNSIEAKGIEASLTGEIFENLTVNATLAITDAEVTKDEPGLNALAGDNLAGIPDVTASLSADYAIPVRDDLEIVLGGTWRYSGEVNSGYSNSPAGNFVADGYSQFDLQVGVRTGPIVANIYVTNVGNTDSFQTVFPITTTSAFGVPIRPRTFGVNLRFDY